MSEIAVRLHGSRFYFSPEGKCRNILVVGAPGYKFTIGGVEIAVITQRYQLIRIEKYLARLLRRVKLARKDWLSLTPDDIMILELNQCPWYKSDYNPSASQWTEFDFDVIGAVLVPVPGFASPDMRDGPRVWSHTRSA